MKLRLKYIILRQLFYYSQKSIPILIIIFLSSCYFFKSKELVIGIQPFENISSSTIETVKGALENYYGIKIVVLHPVKLPSEAYYSPRKRYRADKLIAYLKKYKSEQCDIVIGITNKDISTSIKGYEDYGIMGLAYLGGESCVISDFRLKKNLKNQSQLRDRISKDALHEIGHTLGLPHCGSADYCFMQDAKGKVATLDKAKKELCTICLSKLNFQISK